MNPFEMVVIIVVDRDDRERDEGQIFAPPPPRRSKAIPRSRSKRCACKDEVKQLKERIHVLERIATDKENTLSRQIEELRDRK